MDCQIEAAIATPITISVIVAAVVVIRLGRKVLNRQRL
jgi:hypothetical protein